MLFAFLVSTSSRLCRRHLALLVFVGFQLLSTSPTPGRGAEPLLYYIDSRTGWADSVALLYPVSLLRSTARYSTTTTNDRRDSLQYRQYQPIARLALRGDRRLWANVARLSFSCTRFPFLFALVPLLFFLYRCNSMILEPLRSYCVLPFTCQALCNYFYAL